MCTAQYQEVQAMQSLNLEETTKIPLGAKGKSK